MKAAVEDKATMMERFEGRIGTTLSIALSGEIQAISFTSTVPFEFRLLRNHEATQFPLAIEQLADWQTFDPQNAEPCHTTLYPCEGGTRGLDAPGLGVETRGLFQGASFVVFVWRRE